MNSLANIQKLKAEDYQMVEVGSAEYIQAVSGLSNASTIRKKMVKITNPDVVTPMFMGEVTASNEEFTGRILGYFGQKSGQCRVQLGTWDSQGNFQPKGGIIKAISQFKETPQGERMAVTVKGPALLQKNDPGDLTRVLNSSGESSEEFFFLTTSETYSVREADFDHSTLFCSSEREVEAKERRVKEMVVDARAGIAVEEVMLDFKIKKARYDRLVNASPAEVEAAEAAASEL